MIYTVPEHFMWGRDTKVVWDNFLRRIMAQKKTPNSCNEWWSLNKHLLSTYSGLVTVLGQCLWPRRHGLCLMELTLSWAWWGWKWIVYNKVQWTFWVLWNAKARELYGNVLFKKRLPGEKAEAGEGRQGACAAKTWRTDHGGQTSSDASAELRCDQHISFKPQLHYSLWFDLRWASVS